MASGTSRNPAPPERAPARCWSCGYRTLIPTARAGRVVRYRGAALTLPVDLLIPACRRCGYERIGLESLPGELLESLYRRDLCARAADAITRLKHVISQRHLEVLLNLSQGYLSRLRAGAGVPAATLVSFLATLAAHPELLLELESYWSAPMATVKGQLMPPTDRPALPPG
jgi:hypothetical protein